MGAGCSVASEPVAEILHYWGLSQVITFATNTIHNNVCICVYIYGRVACEFPLAQLSI